MDTMELCSSDISPYHSDWKADICAEISQQRFEVSCYFDNLIAESWLKLSRSARRLVWLYQQMMGPRTQPPVRRLVQMSFEELAELGKLANSHIFSPHVSSCRNLSKEALTCIGEPAFIALSEDLVLAFDPTDLCFFNVNSQIIAVAKIWIQMGPDDFRSIQCPLTLKESSLYHQSSSPIHSSPKHHIEDEELAVSMSQRLKLEPSPNEEACF